MTNGELGATGQKIYVFIRDSHAATGLVPMGQLASRLAEIDKDGPVYLICRSGNRSGAMLDLLVAQGFDAYNVAGGTVAWAQSGRPLDQGM